MILTNIENEFYLLANLINKLKVDILRLGLEPESNYKKQTLLKTIANIKRKLYKIEKYSNEK